MPDSRPDPCHLPTRIAISFKLPPIAPIPKYLTWASLILNHIQLEVLNLAEPLQPDTNLGDPERLTQLALRQHKTQDDRRGTFAEHTVASHFSGCVLLCSPMVL